jgi:hypothetical protein
MSDPSNRQSAKTTRRWAELLHLQEQQRLWAEDAARQLRNQREELLRRWMMQHLDRTDPQPGQPHDTLLGDLIGDKSLIKRSKMASMSLAVTSLQPHDGGWLLEAKGTVGKSMRKAFQRLRRRALGQMANRELPSAGAILDADVDDRGMATISARVVDATVAAKLRSNVYPLLQVIHAGNEILAVDLVDTDLSKGASDRHVLVQLYQGEGMSPKKAAKLARLLPTSTIQKAAPPSVAQAAATILLNTPLLIDAGDPQRRQLHTAAAIELIKASRLKGPIDDPRLRMTAGLR